VTTGFPVKAAGLEIHPEVDGYVIYQAARDKVHFLNHTAVFVLELCDGALSVADIQAIFRETFPPSENPEQAVDEVLAQFVAEDLVRFDPSAASAPVETAP